MTTITMITTASEQIERIKGLLSLDPVCTYTIHTKDASLILKTNKDYNKQKVLREIKKWIEVEGRIR